MKALFRLFLLGTVGLTTSERFQRNGLLDVLQISVSGI